MYLAVGVGIDAQSREDSAALGERRYHSGLHCDDDTADFRIG